MLKKILIGLGSLVLLLFIGIYGLKWYTKSHSPQEKVAYTERGLMLEVNYSRPYKKGRDIYGGLVPYNKVWRTGANEATTFETKTDILVQGQELKAGVYALFTIPNTDKWTIIYNKTDEQWGAFNYDETKDVLRVQTKPEELYGDKFEEQLLIDFDDSGMNITWDLTKVHINISKK